MPNILNDQELIARCITGHDEEAWEFFVRKYSRLIWSCVHRTFRSSSVVFSRDDAEDAFCSIFLALVENDFRKMRQFEGRNACRLSTWLTVVSVNHTIDHIRKSGHARQTELDAADAPEDELIDQRPSIEDLLISRQLNDALDKSIAALPDGDKAVYDLLYNRRFPPEKAAQTLGLSLSALYTRKHRLIDKLKKNLIPV